MKFFTSSELFEELKNYDSDTLLFVHVFPDFDMDFHKFYTDLCDVRSAIALSHMLSKFSNNIRFTFNFQ